MTLDQSLPSGENETNADKIREDLVQSYINLVINAEQTGDDRALNAYNIAQGAGYSEEQFYRYFSSPDQVGSHVWQHIGQQVRDTLQQSEAFAQYSAREKILAYLFTFFEVALPYRTFIQKTFHKTALRQSYNSLFQAVLADIVQSGVAANEMRDRLSISTFYPNILLNLHMRLVRFWLNDKSENFADTDRAVEIYSRVVLDLMAYNIFDSIYDSLKFGIDRFIANNKISFFN
jgi:AcrR family transcriptional regulator